MQRFEAVNAEEVQISVHVRARTHRDGVTVEHSPAALATVREGLLVRMRFYLDPDEARADARR
jgi:ketosteroid isomerase-like protein